jgi:hypothetical protein
MLKKYRGKLDTTFDTRYQCFKTFCHDNLPPSLDITMVLLLYSREYYGVAVSYCGEKFYNISPLAYTQVALPGTIRVI